MLKWLITTYDVAKLDMLKLLITIYPVVSDVAKLDMLKWLIITYSVVYNTIFRLLILLLCYVTNDING